MYSAPYVGMNTITKFSDDAWESDTYHKFRTWLLARILDRSVISARSGVRWTENTVSGMRVTENPMRSITSCKNVGPLWDLAGNARGNALQTLEVPSGQMYLM